MRATCQPRVCDCSTHRRRHQRRLGGTARSASHNSSLRNGKTETTATTVGGVDDLPVGREMACVLQVYEPWALIGKYSYLYVNTIPTDSAYMCRRFALLRHVTSRTTTMPFLRFYRAAIFQIYALRNNVSQATFATRYSLVCRRTGSRLGLLSQFFRSMHCDGRHSPFPLHCAMSLSRS